MRARFWIAAAFVLLLAAAGTVLALRAMSPGSSADALPVITDIGGDFELAGANGVRVRSQDYRGHILLLFFGYTYCPDVCPTSLQTLKLATDTLGKLAKRVQVMMITVDPERDSPQHLQEYVRYFDSHFLGLDGTPDEIRRVAQQYRAYYTQDVSSDGSYRVSHSAFVYLLDQHGRTRAIFGTDSKPVDIAYAVRQLLSEQ